MKLFVDDVRLCPDGWILARTITQAVRLLASGNVTEVSLDHDIACRLVSGQEHTSNETFEPVAYYLVLMSKRPEIRIHTANVVAGQRMASILEIPYGNEIFDYENYNENS